MTIVITSDGASRLTAVLEIAAATAALGRPVRCFFSHEAVRLLAEGGPLLVEALALGVRVIACQTGLAETGIAASSLPDGVEVGGPIGLMADAAEDQLLVA